MPRCPCQLTDILCRLIQCRHKTIPRDSQAEACVQYTRDSIDTLRFMLHAMTLSREMRYGLESMLADAIDAHGDVPQPEREEAA